MTGLGMLLVNMQPGFLYPKGCPTDMDYIFSSPKSAVPESCSRDEGETGAQIGAIKDIIRFGLENRIRLYVAESHNYGEIRPYLYGRTISDLRDIYSGSDLVQKIAKYRTSAFSGTRLISDMEYHEVSGIVLMGTNASSDIAFTARHAVQAGLAVITSRDIITDCSHLKAIGRGLYRKISLDFYISNTEFFQNRNEVIRRMEQWKEGRRKVQKESQGAYQEEYQKESMTT